MTDNGIMPMVAQHARCGRKLQVPQLLQLNVCEVMEGGTLVGDCFVQPYTLKLYKKVHQAIQNLQRKRGWKFTTSILPAGYNKLKSKSLGVWRTK